MGTQGTVRLGALAVVCVAALFAAPATGAATIRVNCAKKKLQPRLDSAPAGSTILVKGTCVGTAVIQKNLTLKGDPKATIDGNNASSGVYITGNYKVRLVRLKITRGAGLQGGGVTSFGSVTLDHCTVTGNHAQVTGAGILAANKVTLIDSSVVHNTLEWSAFNAVVSGGGISANSVRLVRSVVRNNVAHAIGTTSSGGTALGGGIVVGKSLVAIRSHIDRNTARADSLGSTALGGGIHQRDGGTTVRLTRSTVNNNEANAAGALSTGPATAQGGGVHAVRVVAANTSFVGNKLNAFSGFNQATVQGGAIFAANTSSLTAVQVRSSVLAGQAGGNVFAGGAGVYFSGGSGTYSIAGSTISGNKANALASGNATAWGGGVLSNGRLAVTRSTFSGNTLDSHASAGDGGTSGGGIRAGGLLTLERSTVSGNTAKSDATTLGATAQGGGVAIATGPGGENRIVNSTVTKNVARADASIAGPSSIAIAEGGGIYVQLSPTRLTNTTVARNTAAGQGQFPFIRGGGTIVDSSGLTLRNSILALNTAPDAPDCGGPGTSLGHNLIGTTAGCPLAPAPSDKTNRNAKLGTLGAHGGPTRTIPLLKGSPALNAIAKAACAVKTDQRGVKRPKEKRCEIGAWERSPQ